MTHLGIVAHSVEGAALCFREFAQQGFRALGPHDHPDVTLDCIPLARSMPGWEAGTPEGTASVREILTESVRRTERAGADFFVCPDNTAHLAFELPGDELPLPGLHIAQVVAERAAADGRKRVGVLGTRFTMDGHVYPEALAAQGLEAAVPGAVDREAVDRIIFEELVNGVFTDASREEYVRIIGRLAADGCDAVALVCTEIPLLITPEVSPLPTLDSTRLLARAAFEVCVGRRPLPTWRGGTPH
ncbi:amino acid racemase [Streptomyces sp. HNM0574]|uniref:aspartate/glutamate racemase family protein n=1 Tax=Streptomyces sp. HNM0574 TaxID=2714954 RepID=UPI00146A7C8F|nr:amino acid racemase [Streptomyces sp. HNM0574]NLU70290.1 amino acid racemase [Streptomyces sp. HNM0574]